VAVGGDLGGAEALTLASTSPQRRAILEQLAIPFEVVAPDYVEDDPPDADFVELLEAEFGSVEAHVVEFDNFLTGGIQ